MKVKLRSTLLLLAVIGLSVTSCKKEEEEGVSCPDDTFFNNYVNELVMEDSTIIYYGQTLKLTYINLVYSASGDYSLKLKASGVDLDILFRPPNVKNCVKILQTESTLPYASKLASGSEYGFGMVLWDKTHYIGHTACQTQNLSRGYVKMTTNSGGFNLKFANVKVQSEMYWDEPAQPVSLNITLPYDCSVVCPE